jgi:DNA-binding protein HU-beta
MSPAKNTAPPTKAAAKKVAAPMKAAASPKGAAAAAKKSAASAKVAATAKKPAPSKKGSPAKAGPQITVTLKQMAAELAESHDLPKKQAEAVLGDLVTLAIQHLKQGDKIRLTGLGILSVQMRQARMGRNPATGEAIQIKASKKISFRPSKEVKEAV